MNLKTLFKLHLLTILLLAVSLVSAQRTTISFESNGRLDNQSIQEAPEASTNPFSRFIGEWTLKDDLWMQNWGGEDDTIKIEGHHTVCAQLNTDNSLLSIIDGPEPNGHIFWLYNPNTKVVSYLSSFGSSRAGVGEGAIYGADNLRLKVSFEGEAEGTYRIYNYEWKDKDTYHLHSTQYDQYDRPTGLFYAGTFVRIPHNDLKAEVTQILTILDDTQISIEDQLQVYADDITHMAPDHPVIDNKADLATYLRQQRTYGTVSMTHHIIELSQHDNIVLLRGKVTGTFTPANGSAPFPFQTKNIFVFRRIDGELKIKQVIYNGDRVE